MVARNQLAVWLAQRQQVHLSLAGRSSLARAFGLAPDLEPSLSPLLARTSRIRRRRRLLPARMTVEFSRATVEELPQSAPETGTFDVVDEEMVIDVADDMVDEEMTVDDVDTESPTLSEPAADPLADLPRLRALMRAVIRPPAPASERPLRNPARPVRPHLANTMPTGETIGTEAEPEHIASGEVIPVSSQDIPAPVPESQPESVVLGSTYVASAEKPLTPPVPEAFETVDVVESSSPEQLDAEPPFTPEDAHEVADEPGIPSPPVEHEQQAETPTFSPRYWLERLEQVERRERQATGNRQVSMDEPVAETPLVPESLPAPTVRFLRPLVGVDPESVPIYRETPDTPIVSEAGADAIAVDDEILLAFDQQTSTPGGAGLLAHELTHVARRRTPRFVPPVVRTLPGVAGDGEEQIARRVESRVQQVARAEKALPKTRPDDQLAPESSVLLPETSAASEPVQQYVLRHGEDVAAFGGLPAPWEPMPDLFNRPEPPAGMSAGDSIWHQEINLPLQQAAEGASPVVHHAESGRSVEETPAPERPSAPQPPVEPDLDALARQVYAVLRRRLLAEQRRAG